MDREAHWEHVFRTKALTRVSWFQPEPATSLAMIDAAGFDPRAWLIDVGGGDSRLVDALVARGASCVSVLDISRAALDRVRARLGERAGAVRWIEADVTGEWPVTPVAIWHDRAVFHFLTDAGDRRQYVSRLRQTVLPGGHVILSTFALDGPATCSGLPVTRHSAETLSAELGRDFALVKSFVEEHATPSGATQMFCWALFRRQATEGH